MPTDNVLVVRGDWERLWVVADAADALLHEWPEDEDWDDAHQQLFEALVALKQGDEGVAGER